MKLLHFPWLFCLITSSAFSQIGAKAQQGKIFGNWTNSQFGYEMSLQLNVDGTGTFDGEPIGFTSTATTLAISTQNETTTYNYVLNGNSLTVSGGDLDQAVTFIRKNTTEAKPTSEKNQTKQLA